MNNPAPIRTRRQKVEAREQAILESARRVFFQKGYEGARMSEIAAGAQIAEGTIYIYYKNKAALMRAISSEFWQSLTADAWTEIDGLETPYEALRALARFHITSLMEQSDMIDLTHSLRVVSADVGTTTEELRTYVRVFDTLYLKGVDRGELIAHPALWLVRDVFFGTLDYSARTLRLHDDQNVAPVVDNLIDGIWAQYGASGNGVRSSEAPTPSRLMGRLEKAVKKLEQLSQS